jgi:hypothetical protein
MASNTGEADDAAHSSTSDILDGMLDYKGSLDASSLTVTDICQQPLDNMSPIPFEDILWIDPAAALGATTEYHASSIDMQFQPTQIMWSPSLPVPPDDEILSSHPLEPESLIPLDMSDSHYLIDDPMILDPAFSLHVTDNPVYSLRPDVNGNLIQVQHDGIIAIDPTLVTSAHSKIGTSAGETIWELAKHSAEDCQDRSPTLPATSRNGEVQEPIVIKPEGCHLKRKANSDCITRPDLVRKMRPVKGVPDGLCFSFKLPAPSSKVLDSKKAEKRIRALKTCSRCRELHLKVTFMSSVVL